MNTNDVNTQDFQELIERYLDGKTTLEEVKLLVNYYESFQQDHEWVEELGPEDTIKNRMLINILEVLQDESPKVIPIYKRSFFKYAAAIVIFLSAGYFFLNKDNLNNESPTQIIVNNNIKVGSDKAILTLEDGTNVTLEKGQQYISDHIESTGEAIVYSVDQTKLKPSIAYNYLTVLRGGQYHVTLSDGTEVWLNSESKLKYPTAFVDGEDRRVELVYGEAYFDVSPSTAHQGAKFKVTSGLQDIEVLGTEFNIKAYQDEDSIYTTLVEGKVMVNYGTANTVLAPNQQSIIAEGIPSINVKTMDVFTATSWRKGVFTFKDMPLSKITKVLSRWYDMNVIFVNKDVEAIKFTGVLGKEQSIEDILSTMYNTNSIPYEINNKTIIFK